MTNFSTILCPYKLINIGNTGGAYKDWPESGKSGQARIGQATIVWCFLGQAIIFFGFFDFYSFLNRFYN